MGRAAGNRRGQRAAGAKADPMTRAFNGQRTTRGAVAAQRARGEGGIGVGRMATPAKGGK